MRYASFSWNAPWSLNDYQRVILSKDLRIFEDIAVNVTPLDRLENAEQNRKKLKIQRLNYLAHHNQIL